MTGFFETRIENVERFDTKNDSKKNQNNRPNKKRKYSINNVSDGKTSKRSEFRKNFASIMKCVDTVPMNVHLSKI